MEKQTSAESLEEAIFKTLSSQKRRDILRVIGEHRQATFTEIKAAAQIEDSPSLSYHLNALSGLIVQNQNAYSLSDLGRDAYGLICKTASSSIASSTINFLKRGIPALIITNALLWALAILLVSQFEGKLSMASMTSFAVLWLASNGILYSLQQRVRGTIRCRYLS